MICPAVPVSFILFFVQQSFSAAVIVLVSTFWMFMCSWLYRRCSVECTLVFLCTVCLDVDRPVSQVLSDPRTEQKVEISICVILILNIFDYLLTK